MTAARSRRISRAQPPPRRRRFVKAHNVTRRRGRIPVIVHAGVTSYSQTQRYGHDATLRPPNTNRRIRRLKTINHFRVTIATDRQPRKSPKVKAFLILSHHSNEDKVGPNHACCSQCCTSAFWQCDGGNESSTPRQPKAFQRHM